MKEGRKGRGEGAASQTLIVSSRSDAEKGRERRRSPVINTGVGFSPALTRERKGRGKKKKKRKKRMGKIAFGIRLSRAQGF